MWRSLLFVPVLEDRLVQGATRRGADAIVLDLEAAVPPDRKEEARAKLASVISRHGGSGTPVAVRVNRTTAGGERDIAAAVGAGANIIVLPRATPAATARAAVLAGDAVPLIPLIEDPRGVIEALAVAEAAPSVAGLGFGVEDYATDMGAPPTPELLLPAAFQVIQAARAAGRAPLVLPDMIADYRDLQRFEAAAGKARALGATRFCDSPRPGRCHEPNLCPNCRGTESRPTHCRSGGERSPGRAGSGQTGRTNDRRAR